MAAAQQVMAAGGPRPTPPQAPPPQPGMVLQHAPYPQPHLGPAPNLATVTQFAQGANFAHQIPLQHPNQRPIMNGLPLSGHQNFPTLANNANQIAARQAQLRQQNSNIPPGTMAQLQYQTQIPPGMHSQQLHQMQQYHQQQQQAANAGIRLPQHQMIPAQPLIQQQVMPVPAIQQMPGPQAPQPMIAARYIHYITCLTLI
jgi:hypothetical protein